MSADTLRAEVGAQLKRSGAFFTRRACDPEALETFRVPGRGATGWVFWNGGAESVEAEREGHRLRIGPSRAGYLQIGAAGAVEFQGEL